MIKFEKVSMWQFYKSYKNLNGELTEEEIEKTYKELKIPERATKKSAGYDFFAPFSFSLAPGETIKIPTGIRAIMKDDMFLAIFPRSGLGFKYREQLDNTVGIIDADYCDSDNEGHIFLKITNDSKTDKVMEVEKGKGFAQGIFMKYYTVDNDKVNASRNGGFGSTDTLKDKEIMTETDQYGPVCFEPYWSSTTSAKITFPQYEKVTLS